MMSKLILIQKIQNISNYYKLKLKLGHSIAYFSLHLFFVNHQGGPAALKGKGGKAFKIRVKQKKKPYYIKPGRELASASPAVCICYFSLQ